MNKSNLTLLSRSAQQTKIFGENLGKHLGKGDVVLFVADLGCGKTAFVQGVAKSLGVKENALSPTFVMAQTLKGRIPVHHLDFYRLTPEEILNIGIQDYLTGSGEIGLGVVLIEWADRMRHVWPPKRLEINIKIKPRTLDRLFKFQARGEHYKKILGRMRSH